MCENRGTHTTSKDGGTVDKNEALTLLKGERSQLEKWNMRRAEGEALPNLEGADLSGHSFGFLYSKSTDGFVADFSKLNMSGAKFIDSTLTGVRFDQSILDSANFRKARLGGARLVSTS